MEKKPKLANLIVVHRSCVLCSVASLSGLLYILCAARGLPCGSGTFLPGIRLSSVAEVTTQTRTAEDCCEICASNHEICRVGFTFSGLDLGQPTCVVHAASYSLTATTCYDCISFLRVAERERRQITNHLRLLEQLQPILWIPTDELRIIRTAEQQSTEADHMSGGQQQQQQQQRGAELYYSAADIEKCKRCERCEDGDPTDGGVPQTTTGRTSICLEWCSHDGFCGAGRLYRSTGSTDCHICGGVPLPQSNETVQDCLQCYACHAGAASDGGVSLASDAAGDRCVLFCSPLGYCGDSQLYRSDLSTDCRPCADFRIVRVPDELSNFAPARDFLERCEVCAHCRVDLEGGNLLSGGRCSTFCSADGFCQGSMAEFGTDCRSCTHLQHDFRPRHWGIVFPLRGDLGSHRLKVAKATWLSLCRAMRRTRGREFHVIAIDSAAVPSGNSQLQWLREWRGSCKAPNLQTLMHVEGHKSIAKNMKMGYEWASQYEYIMNLDSDMLVVEDFFYKLEQFHKAALVQCSTPLISGFASNLRSWEAFGANLMFTNTSFSKLMNTVANHSDIWNSGAHNLEAKVQSWDQRLASAFTAQCGSTLPWTPENSYLHHIGFSDGILHERDEQIVGLMSKWNWQENKMGLHRERDQLAELSLRFRWDAFTIELASTLNPLFGAQTSPPAQVGVAINVTTGCYDGPHEGSYLLSCAVDLDVAFRSCIEFSALQDAQMACLGYETCGGVTEATEGVFTLRSGSKLVRVPTHSGCRRWILPRSWVRVAHTFFPTITSPDQCNIHAPELRRGVRCRDCADCAAGALYDGGVQLTGGHCRAFCSSSGFCGTSAEYIRSGTDCRDCEAVIQPEIAGRRLNLIPQRSPPKQLAPQQHHVSSRKGVVDGLQRYLMGRSNLTNGIEVAANPAENLTAWRVRTKHWGVVFPFHASSGSDRMRIVNVTWLSMCRAMRTTKNAIFHVIAIDDAGTLINSSPSTAALNTSEFKRTATHFNVPNFENPVYQEKWLREWRGSCKAPNLQTLMHVEGHKSIAKNMKMGYEWASQYEYIMNLDSDMLVVEDFFYKLDRDYQQALTRCHTPIISGYTSNLMVLSYGAHFLFNQATFQHIVRNISTPLVEAWDDALGVLHTNVCGEWPRRPYNSYAHHMAPTAGTHYMRDGDMESGLRFEWDEVNLALKSRISYQFALRSYSHVRRIGMATTTDTAICFDGPHRGKVMLHCAASFEVMIDHRTCFSFTNLTEALHACLRMQSCSGVVTHEQSHTHTLHSDAALSVESVPPLENCRERSLTAVWIRKDKVYRTNADGEQIVTACVADPAVISTGERESMAEMLRIIRQRCSSGYFARCNVRAVWDFEPEFILPTWITANLHGYS